MTVPLPEPILVTESVGVADGAVAVLIEKDLDAELRGLGAVCDWFVTTSTGARQPAGLKLTSVLDAPLAAMSGSGLSRRSPPVSQTTVPRSWPPADVFASVTLYSPALEGRSTQASA